MEPNTKAAIVLLSKMGNGGKKVLFVLDKKEDGVDFKTGLSRLTNFF